MKERPQILVLFPNDWDRAEFAREKYTVQYDFVFGKYPGDYFFSYPGYLKLPFFNIEKYIEQVVAEVEINGYDAIISSDEYIGAAIAAEVSKRTGRAGSNPKDIILCQHKYYSRLRQLEIVPQLAVDCQLLPFRLSENFNFNIDFPFFVKPVKGTFSLFAKKVNSLEELHDHLNFNWFERRVLKYITKPFNWLIHNLTDLQYNANHMVAEELGHGIQVTVDGYVFEGEVTILGVVDSVMFEGTNIFERFEYPSRLPVDIQSKMSESVIQLIEGLKFDTLQFNVELFYDASSEKITIIEINPRLSYQFADLYENVTGTNSYEILIDLGLGKQPGLDQNIPEFKYSISFVLRTFEGKRLLAIPETDEIRAFNERYPESRIKIYGSEGQKLDQEMRAIGSYRYGIINVGADSYLDIFAIYEHALDELTFKFET